MTSLLSVIPIVLRRIRANGRLLAAVVTGAVLASALMSTTSIYQGAIKYLGLSYAIRQQGVDKANILVASRTQISRRDVYEKSRDFIDQAEKQTLGPLLTGQNWTGRSATFFPTAAGQRPTEENSRPRANFQFLSDLPAHIRVVSGRMPAAATPATEDKAPTIEVALSADVAARSNVKLGDRFDLFPFWVAVNEPVHVMVVGLVEPINQADPYWLGVNDWFDLKTNEWESYEFFVDQASFLDGVAGYLPTMSSDFNSLVYLDTSQVNPGNAAKVRLALQSLDRQLQANIERTTLQTDLTDILGTYAQKLFFSRVPLLVLVLQISGIVLYYLFMVSTMLVERQTGEISLLKSRGATTGQVMQIYVIEGLAVLLIALAAGPPLAAGVVALLGKTPAFHDLSNGGLLHASLSPAAYAWALAGALLAYLTLLWPAYQATRKTVVQQRTASARPPLEPAFTRYYLDLGLVALGAVLFYQLNRRGTLVTHKIFGDQAIDPVSLLTPAFFILTVGIFFLRLFPLVLRVAAWAVGKSQGTAVLIGMWQLVRNPVHYSRLVLLLMLATAVGMFAASFGATLDRSYADRAAYEAGAPVRLSDIRRLDAPGPTALASTVQQTYGAERASAAFRAQGSQGLGFNRTEVDVLGVDPSTFGDIAFSRSDYGGTSLDGMMKVLAKDDAPPAETPLPAEARWAGAWVRPVELNGRVNIELRVRDANGRYFTVALGPAAGVELGPGWSFLAGDLAAAQAPPGDTVGSGPAAAPLTLLSVGVRFVSRISANNGSIDIDNLQVSSSASLPGTLATDRLVRDQDRTFAGLPNAQTLLDFDDIGRWDVFNGIVGQLLNDTIRQVPSGTSGTALELSWRPVPGQPLSHGVRLKGDDGPLSVFVSDGFVRSTGLGVGRTTSIFVGSTYIDVKLAGTFHLFPTFGDTRADAAMIGSSSRMLALLNRNPRTASAALNDVWLDPGQQTVAQLKTASANGKLAATLFIYDDVRAAQKKDPLVAAGWEGMLFLSFGAVLVLSAIGYLIYSYLTAQKRTLEFAVLRTMGFSRRQIASVVGFEQVFIIGLGLIAGALMGLRLGSLMIKYTGVTETGASVLPPMVSHVSWIEAGTALLILGTVFVVTIGIVVLLYSRLALHRVLRIGET